MAAIDPDSTRLIQAVINNDISAVNRLLDRGVSPNAVTNRWKQSSLWFAALRGHYDILVDLLRYGATIDARDWDGTTPLFMASQEGREVCVAALLDAGADTELARRGDGERPLGVAARKGHQEVVELLVRRGARVNQVSQLSR